MCKKKKKSKHEFLNIDKNNNQYPSKKVIYLKYFIYLFILY